MSEFSNETGQPPQVIGGSPSEYLPAQPQSADATQGELQMQATDETVPAGDFYADAVPSKVEDETEESVPVYGISPGSTTDRAQKVTTETTAPIGATAISASSDISVESTTPPPELPDTKHIATDTNEQLSEVPAQEDEAHINDASGVVVEHRHVGDIRIKAVLGELTSERSSRFAGALKDCDIIALGIQPSTDGKEQTPTEDELTALLASDADQVKVEEAFTRNIQNGDSTSAFLSHLRGTDKRVVYINMATDADPALQHEATQAVKDYETIFDNTPSYEAAQAAAWQTVQAVGKAELTQEAAIQERLQAVFSEAAKQANPPSVGVALNATSHEVITETGEEDTPGMSAQNAAELNQSLTFLEQAVAAWKNGDTELAAELSERSVVATYAKVALAEAQDGCAISELTSPREGELMRQAHSFIAAMSEDQFTGLRAALGRETTRAEQSSDKESDGPLATLRPLVAELPNPKGIVANENLPHPEAVELPQTEIVIERRRIRDVEVKAIQCVHTQDNVASVVAALQDCDIVAVELLDDWTDAQRAQAEQRINSLFSRENPDGAYYLRQFENRGFALDVLSHFPNTNKRVAFIDITSSHPAFPLDEKSERYRALKDNQVNSLVPIEDIEAARTASQQADAALHQVRERSMRQRINAMAAYSNLSGTSARIGVVVGMRHRAIFSEMGEPVDGEETRHAAKLIDQSLPASSLASEAMQRNDIKRLPSLMDRTVLTDLTAYALLRDEYGQQKQTTEKEAIRRCAWMHEVIRHLSDEQVQYFLHGLRGDLSDGSELRALKSLKVHHTLSPLTRIINTASEEAKQQSA